MPPKPVDAPAPELLAIGDRRRPEVQALRPDGRRMLTIDEVAYHLNCTPRIVRKLIAHGILRTVKYSARVTRIPEQAVLAILNR